MSKPIANTLGPIKLDIEKLSTLGFEDFVKHLLDELQQYKDRAFNYYEQLREARSRWRIVQILVRHCHAAR